MCATSCALACRRQIWCCYALLAFAFVQQFCLATKKMHQAIFGLEALSQDESKKGYLTPYNMTIACVILEMMMEDFSAEVKRDVGCLVLDELTNVDAYKNHDVVRFLFGVAAHSPEISEGVVQRMTSFVCPDDIADFFEDVQGLIKPQVIGCACQAPSDTPTHRLRRTKQNSGARVWPSRRSAR